MLAILRTHTPRRAPDFESGASASSATSARGADRSRAHRMTFRARPAYSRNHLGCGCLCLGRKPPARSQRRRPARQRCSCVAIAFWLIVNLIKTPGDFFEVTAIGSDERLRLRARRARLHARLRDPRADQLRPRRRVHARRHVHDHLRHALLRPPPRPGAGARPRHLRDARPDDGHLRRAERDDRVLRLPAAPIGAATCAADHRDRRQLHHRERRARGLGPGVRDRARRAAALRRLQHRLVRLPVEQADRGDHHRPGAARARLSDPAARGRARRCARPPRTRTRAR